MKILYLLPLLLLGCAPNTAPESPAPAPVPPMYTVTVLGPGGEPVRTWKNCTNIWLYESCTTFVCNGKFIRVNAAYIAEQE